MLLGLGNSGWYVRPPVLRVKLTVGRYTQALEGMQSGPLEQVPIQDYFPAAKELSPVEFA